MTLVQVKINRPHFVSTFFRRVALLRLRLRFLLLRLVVESRCAFLDVLLIGHFVGVIRFFVT